MVEELAVAVAFDDESLILDVDSAAPKEVRPAGATRRKGGDSGSAQHEEDLSTSQWHTTSTGRLRIQIGAARNGPEHRSQDTH